MIEIFDCAQNSLEWHRARMGIPTASMFKTVLAKGRDGGASLTRKTYMLKLAGEIITGEPCENYSNDHMERGHIMEAEARDLYAFLQDEPLQSVGFIKNGPAGCSPDSFVGTNGIVQIKTNLPHILIETLLADKFPAEHVAQCQGELWVSEREWIDIACYWPKLPLFVKRAYRDEPYIKQLAEQIDRFNAELFDIVCRVKARAA